MSYIFIRHFFKFLKINCSIPPPNDIINKKNTTINRKSEAMQKLLKLLFTLSTATTLALSVTACNQQDLDHTLNIIQNGSTNYNINEISDKPLNNEAVKDITLKQEQSQALAKSIAEKILNDNKSETNLIWFNENAPINQQCYDFKITNGKNKSGTDLTWKVQSDNQRFQINISYLVGTIKQDKSFEAKQRIKTVFYIKVGTSESDKKLDEWINNFNNKNWNETNPIEINLSSKDITKPVNNTDWSNVKQEAITETYQAIKNQLTWPSALNPSIQIQNINDKVKNDLLKLQLIVNLGDSKANTNDFYIKFV